MARCCGSDQLHQFKLFIALYLLTLITVIDFVILHCHNMAMRPFLPRKYLRGHTNGNVINLSEKDLKFVFEMTCLLIFADSMCIANCNS